MPSEIPTCSTVQKLVCEHSKQQSEKEQAIVAPTLETPFPMLSAILRSPWVETLHFSLQARSLGKADLVA